MFAGNAIQRRDEALCSQTISLRPFAVMSRIPALDGVPYRVAWFDFECDSDFTQMIPQPGWTPPEEIALLTDDPDWQPPAQF